MCGLVVRYMVKFGQNELEDDVVQSILNVYSEWRKIMHAGSMV